MLKKAMFAALLLPAVMAACAPNPESSDHGSIPWRVYDTMHDRPGSQATLGRLGIVPAHVFMKNRLYAAHEDRSIPPTEHRVKMLARQIPSNVLTCMDLEGEDWTRLRKWENGEWVFDEDGYQAFLNIARWINEANPDLVWGFFWNPPVSWLWYYAWQRHREGDIGRRDEILAKWRQFEDRAKPLYDEVPVITISLYYTARKYDSFEEFQSSAEFFFEHWENPTDKPVLVFMCPLDPYSNTTTGARFLTAEQWRWCMEFSRKHTDGLLLWSDVPFKWDVHAAGRPWWHETVRYLSQIDESQAAETAAQP